MSQIICVCVHGAAGKSAEIDIDLQSTIAELKKRLSLATHVPPPLQKLVFGTTLLEDAEPLVKYYEPGSEDLSISLIVQMDDHLMAKVKVPCYQERMATLQSFVEMGFACDLAIHAAFFVMRDPSLPVLVQCEVLGVLAEMVLDSDDILLTAAAASSDEVDRYRAVSTLAILAKEKPTTSDSIGSWARDLVQDNDIPACKSMLQSPMYMRYNALLVLALLQEVGVDHGLDAMITRLEHREEWVRCAASLALAEVSNEGYMTNGVIEHLDHNDPQIRCLAIRALVATGCNRDEHAVPLLEARLADTDSGVQSEAELALEELACHSDIWKHVVA